MVNYWSETKGFRNKQDIKALDEQDVDNLIEDKEDNRSAIRGHTLTSLQEKKGEGSDKGCSTSLESTHKS